MGFQIPPLNPFGPSPLAFYVISGTVGAGTQGHETFVGVGNGMGLGEGWDYVRNVNLTPATIWVIAPLSWKVPTGYDFRFTPWISPSASGGPEKSGSNGTFEMRELMRVQMGIADGKDTGATLGRYSVAPAMHSHTDYHPDCGTSTSSMASSMSPIFRHWELRCHRPRFVKARTMESPAISHARHTTRWEVSP